MRRLLPLLFLTMMFAVVAYAADPVSKVLPNGVRFVTADNTAAKLVSIEILIDCSAIDEPLPIKGLRRVLLSSMLQGSASANGLTLQQRIIDAGGSIEGRTLQDSLELSVTVPPSALATAFSVLADIICHPRLSDADIQIALTQAQQKALLGPDGILDTASWYSYELLYQNHPYTTRGVGAPETISRISPDLVHLAYNYFVSPQNVIVAVAGNCSYDAAVGELEKNFGAWSTSAGRIVRNTVKSPELSTSQLFLREAPVQSTCVMITFPVCGATKEDFLTLRLINTILSGGTGSRLFRDIREQQHLAYEVSSLLPNQINDSYFSVYVLTHNRYLEDTKSALVAEFSRLQTGKVSDRELQRAKAFLKGSILISHQSNAQYAYDLAWDMLSGQGIGYDKAYAGKIDAISADDVQRVARTYFTHYNLVVIVPLSVTASPAS
ncbi:MAG TPA: pitrilysin family protein [Armatimonadota bacterium]|nr:pitrilysin family protein [Armatimonadota bacterium]